MSISPTVAAKVRKEGNVKLEDSESRLERLRRDIDDTNSYAFRRIGKIEAELFRHRVLLLIDSVALIVSVILLLSR